MCNDKSAITCSKATAVFSTVLLLGMIIAVAVFNAMFGPNMNCYVDAVNSVATAMPPPPPPPIGRRQMFEDMRHIAAQNPGGDGVARAKLGLFNVALNLGFLPAIKQLPANLLALAPEGRQLIEAAPSPPPWRGTASSTDTGVPPNTNECDGNNYDGLCDDGGDGSMYSLCNCGTDASDCLSRRSDRSDCREFTTASTDTDKAVSDVENVCRLPVRSPHGAPTIPHCPRSGRAQRVKPGAHYSCHCVLVLPVRRQWVDPQERVPPSLLLFSPCTCPCALRLA